MLSVPFYDPEKSYQDNFEHGPFGDFANSEVYLEKSQPQVDFLGFKVNLPLGIPAGPLLNGAFVKAALDKGFDLPVYKTVRTRAYPCHPWPNVLSIKVGGDLTLEKAAGQFIADNNYSQPLSITNSFGVPSYNPDYWQPDLAQVVSEAKSGQLVIASFQGTKPENGSVNAYIDDFITGARLLQETGVKAIEMNLSCPNEGSAHLLCFDIERTTKIAEAVKNTVPNLPLILKLAYFEDDSLLKKLLEQTSKIVQGYAAINTIATAAVNKEGRQALPGEGRLRSGVCGAAIKWAGLDMVKRMAAWRDSLGLEFTIIGVGGVSSPEDYQDYQLAGADAVMTATGAMWNPYLAQEIKATLK